MWYGDSFYLRVIWSVTKNIKDYHNLVTFQKCKCKKTIDNITEELVSIIMQDLLLQIL